MSSGRASSGGDGGAPIPARMATTTPLPAVAQAEAAVQRLARVDWMRRHAVGNGLRTALVGSLAFSFGHWVLQDLQFAVFATFTAIALLGIADFGGPLRDRAHANLVTGAIAVALVVGGTAVSETIVPATAFALVMAFAISIGSSLGGYAKAGSRVLLIFLVLSIGVPAPFSDVLERGGGVAFTTALVAIASVVCWPSRPRRALGQATAAELERLAALVDALVTGATGDLATRLQEARAGVRETRAAALRMGARPAGSSTRDRSQAFVLDDMSRVLSILTALAGQHPPPSVLGFEEAGRRRLEQAREALLAAAAASRGDAVAIPDRTPPRDLAKAEELLAGAIAEGEAPADDLAAATEWIVGVLELSWAASVALDHSVGLAVPVGRGRRSGPVRTGPGHLLLRGIRIVRADLSPRSARFQDAARTALALGAAVGLATAFELQHGFWVSLATFTVLRTAARATAITAVQAVLGTLIGFVAASSLVVAVDSRVMVLAVFLPVLMFLSVWGNEVLGLIAGQAFFTILVVVLFNLLAPAGWSVALVRAEDVAIGAATGLIIGLVTWPHGSRGRLSRAVAAVLRAGAAYDRTVLLGLLHGRDPRDPRLPERIAAEVAGQRMDETIEHCMAEGRPGPERMDGWVGAAGGAHRLWYSVDHASFEPVPADETLAGLHATAVAEVSAVTEAVLQAADALEQGRTDIPTPATGHVTSRLQECLAAGRGHPEAAASIARTIAIGRWCLAATTNLDLMRSCLFDALGPARR